MCYFQVPAIKHPRVHRHHSSFSPFFLYPLLFLSLSPASYVVWLMVANKPHTKYSRHVSDWVPECPHGHHSFTMPSRHWRDFTFQGSSTTVCYRLNVCGPSPHQIHMRKPYLPSHSSIRCPVIRRKDFGRWWGLDEVVGIESSWMTSSALIPSQENLLPLSALCHVNYKQRSWVYSLVEDFHQNSTMLAPYSDLTASRTVRNEMFLFVSYPVYDIFVTVAY